MILGLFILFIGLIFILIYNSLIAKKNQVINANGTLDAQLKQRYDLIPNLVAVVNQYMQHEKEVIEKVVNLRTKAIVNKISDERREQINKEISQGLTSLLVQVEQYPELKSNTNFLQLQKTLYEVEENIAAARRFYNSSVTIYNNAIEMVPSNIVAKVLGFKLKKLFNIPPLQKNL